jgi:phage terminase large subunit
MPYVITTATKKLAKLKKRIRAIPGGTSAGKTISILQILIDQAQADTKPTLTSVVSESIPHLKRGAMRDFKNIMLEHRYWKDTLWNVQDSTYTFETGSKIEFFSADQPDKLRGARRDRLFINEANNIPFDAFEQLEVRTKEHIFLDWNPTNEFWYYTEIKGKRDDVEELTLTYKDNEGLDEAIVASIEQRRERKGWWQVYGLGQLGEVEGKIYKDWAIIDEIPHEARLERYGLDFGYSNDPAAIVAVYKYNGGYIWDEILYQKGLSNKRLADVLLNQATNVLVVADSAEPKSIDELITYNINAIGAAKGADSVRHGIRLVQDQRISMTKRSVNLIREYRNYLWKTDKNGVVIPGVPEGGFDHALDAGRYAMETLNIDTGLSEIEKYRLAEARRTGGMNFSR